MMKYNWILVLNFATIFATIQFVAPSKADDPYLNLNCKQGACDWYKITGKITIHRSDTGVLVGATTIGCSSKHQDEYPKSYQCPTTDQYVEYVANCSRKAPSIAFKQRNGTWLRTQLSISADGSFGYNISAMAMYLHICHDHIANGISLDMVGAKFGYISRIKEIDGIEQETIPTIQALAHSGPFSRPQVQPFVGQNARVYYVYCTEGKTCTQNSIVEVNYFNNGASSVECSKPRRGCSAARVKTRSVSVVPNRPAVENQKEFTLECDPALGSSVDEDVKVNGKFDHSETMKIDSRGPAYAKNLVDQATISKWQLWKMLCVPLGRRQGPPDRGTKDE